MVDMSVSHHNLAHGKAMLLQMSKNLWNVVSRINHDSFMGSLVAQDGAVAAEWTDRKAFQDHGVILED
jgi:hypothetical protein